MFLLMCVYIVLTRYIPQGRVARTNRLRYYDKASVPLLVGKTEVVAMQGAALFKLRVTSSHRDKQRFRIRISPSDTSLLLREPGLSVVTTGVRR